MSKSVTGFLLELALLLDFLDPAIIGRPAHYYTGRTAFCTLHRFGPFSY
jgi:hypothetical protein